MKILDSMWFTPMGALKPIGIVLGKDYITHKFKCYIGPGEGFDQKADEFRISQEGAKFPLEAAEALFPEKMKKEKT